MLSVVVPAHNEAEHIGGLLEAFGEFTGLELIVTEDASTELNTNIVREFAGRNDHVVSQAATR